MNFADGQMTRYPVLRAVLREDLSRWDDASLEDYLAQEMPGVTAEELEFSFGNLGRSISRGLGQVGNVLGRAAPGAISGAAQGAAMGSALGPYGMLAGAALGAVGGGIASYSQSRRGPAAQRRPVQPQGAAPRRAPPQGAAPTAGSAAPGRAPTPQPVPQRRSRPSAAPGQAAAVSQLLQLLSRPEVVQALLSLSMGRNGRQRIRVGEHVVAPVQMLNAVELVASGMPPGGGESGTVESDPFDAVGVTEAILGELARTAPESHAFAQVLAAGGGEAPEDEADEADGAAYPDWFDDPAEAPPPARPSGRLPA